MVTIIFESHSTTIDNENGLASGFNDVELSEAGITQARELGERYKGKKIDVVFCSDLQRSYRTAELAFGLKIPIIQDERLRECNYGEFTRKSKELIEAEKHQRIKIPFPNGESYEQTCGRVRSFLQEVAHEYDGCTVMIIGHRATQYGLEHCANGLHIKEVVTAPWQWQPGWTYTLDTGV